MPHKEFRKGLHGIAVQTKIISKIESEYCFSKLIYIVVTKISEVTSNLKKTEYFRK